MLHIVNKSPTERSSLESALRLARPGDVILLIEDGVYGAAAGSITAEGIRQAMAEVKLYALLPDLEARGMASSVLEGINLIDYGGFVDLVVTHSPCHSWL